MGSYFGALCKEINYLLQMGSYFGALCKIFNYLLQMGSYFGALCKKLTTLCKWMVKKKEVGAVSSWTFSV